MILSTPHRSGSKSGTARFQALMLVLGLCITTGAMAEEECTAPPARDKDIGQRGFELQQDALMDRHAGKRVHSIRFRNANVFDETLEEESNKIYRFLNRLHVHTLSDVIAAQLLFREGEPLNKDAVNESERILRTRDYFADAYIEVSEICADSVELTVHTRDAWTTEPQISLSHSGGETSSGFALAEGNLLGSGNSVSIGYSKDADRSGVSYYFSSPHFLNSRLAASLGYSRNSDGEDATVKIAYPFYSLKTPRAFGAQFESVTQLEPIRFKGDIINEYRHSVEYQEVWYGEAVDIADNHTHRLLLGLTREQDSFSRNNKTLGSLPTDTDLSYPWLEYQFIENEFAVYRNINQIQRREDLAMGKELVLRVGYGSDDWGNQGDVLRYRGHYSDMLGVGDHHILRFFAHVDGRRHSRSGMPNSTVAGVELAYHLLQDRNNRWFASLRYDVGEDLQPHDKLTVGGVVGVRGYPLDFQRGDQRYILSVERRYFSDTHLFNLFRLGGVVFFDAGRAWGKDTAASSPHLANVGLGLRISSSKAKIGHVVHLDVAFPLADRRAADDVQWLVMAEQTF